MTHLSILAAREQRKNLHFYLEAAVQPKKTAHTHTQETSQRTCGMYAAVEKRLSKTSRWGHIIMREYMLRIAWIQWQQGGL